VAGGWRKGVDRRSVRHLPLTAQVVGAHLSGDVFIGLYFLLTDNTCRFLVADFDGQAAMLDAPAYVKAARANNVPGRVGAVAVGARRACVGSGLAARTYPPCSRPGDDAH
jgi:hypothetical protein